MTPLRKLTKHAPRLNRGRGVRDHQSRDGKARVTSQGAGSGGGGGNGDVFSVGKFSFT